MRSDEIKVIAPNLKKRWSGVTSTVFRLVPLQQSQIAIACTGPNLPDDLPPGKVAVTATVWYSRLVSSVADYMGIPAEEAEPVMMSTHSTSFTVASKS